MVKSSWKTPLFSGLRLDIERNPASLRNVPYLTQGDFDIVVHFGKYQLVYDGTLIFEIYQEGKQSVIEFICVPNSQAVFKAIKASMEIVMPSYELKSMGAGQWTIRKKYM